MSKTINFSRLERTLEGLFDGIAEMNAFCLQDLTLQVKEYPWKPYFGTSYGKYLRPLNLLPENIIAVSFNIRMITSHSSLFNISSYEAARRIAIHEAAHGVVDYIRMKSNLLSSVKPVSVEEEKIVEDFSSRYPEETFLYRTISSFVRNTLSSTDSSHTKSIASSPNSTLEETPPERKSTPTL